MNNAIMTVISDAGVDDIIALYILNKVSPNKNHTIISSFGNVAENYTQQNIQEFIAKIASEWSFMRGAANSMKPFARTWADDFHGPDGVWGVHPEGVDISAIKALNEYPANNTVISLGPVTEVLKIQKKTPFKSIMLMGGAFERGGNQTAHAEYNIYCDPEAGAEFFKKNKDIETFVVPLDVTYKTVWTREKVESAPEDTEVKKWMKRLLIGWFEGWGTAKKQDFVLFDPLAIYLMFHPDEAIWKTSGVDVILDGEERGKTIYNTANPDCKIALDLKNPQEISDKMFEMIFG